jgi:ribonuclease-3 family protein
LTKTALDPIHTNTTALAWVGDAAYELQVRSRLLLSGVEAANADAMHRAAVRYVRADAQARVIRQLLDTLPTEEQDLVKRARNRRITTKPKNADPVTYKWATAFEALIGYYRLTGADEKIDDIVSKAMSIIDKK